MQYAVQMTRLPLLLALGMMMGCTRPCSDGSSSFRIELPAQIHDCRADGTCQMRLERSSKCENGIVYQYLTVFSEWDTVTFGGKVLRCRIVP